MEKKIPNKVSEIQITYNPKVKKSERYVITGSRLAYQLFLEIWGYGTIEYVETFYMLLLNRGNQVLGYVKVSSGGRVGTIVDARTVFAPALKGCATGIILAHNHPSGDPTPSQSDIDMTQKVIKAADSIGLTVHDHVVIGREDVVSFKTLGIM